MAYVDIDLGVIRDARRRQHRRRALAAGLLAAVALTAAIAWTHAKGPAAPPVAQPSPAPMRSVSPKAAFWRQPYMGVACRIPNSAACDRVGLAVWLRRPAVAVTASVAGTTLRLRTGAHSPSQWRYRPPRTGFTGYLRPSGLLTALGIPIERGTAVWYGSPTPRPLVTFRIDYGHGNVVATRLRVPLMAGWG